MDPLLASLPIIALVAAMTVRAPKLRLPLPAHLALPGAAGLALVLQASAGPSGMPSALAARVIEGSLTALMPLAIVFGAVLLFRTLGKSGALDALAAHLERSVPDPVLRVVLIAWSFAYLVEGLSGFGTPAALAAPLLVGLGHPPIRACAACLVMNTAPVVFGAVGMPIWFGFGELNLTAVELRSVGLSAALVQCAAAPVVVGLGLRLLFPFRALRGRFFAIAFVIVATVGASAITALFSVEFPTIVGGACGVAAAFAAGRLLGDDVADSGSGWLQEAAQMPFWRAGLPLAATVALLALTRIEPLGLHGLLNAETPGTTISLGPVGALSVSAALVVGLSDILGTGISWSMPLLYVPFIIPFVVVALASAPLLGLSGRSVVEVWSDAARRLVLPAAALAGALVFVKLMMHGGDAAPLVAIGRALAVVVGGVDGALWIGAAPLLGALGSFFSGSATVSNLTFGPVQAEIARNLGLETERVLAFQAVGAAIGNMVCVHNIVAVAAVLGLTRRGKDADVEAPESAAIPVRSASPVEEPVSAILKMNALPLAAALVVAGLAAALVEVV